MRRLLVANRGEIARRVFATCRRMGIATAAVYSDADADAPFVREADVAVRLGGVTAAESYLRGDAVIAAAIKVGADAIHPGYGFLAESADFARAVIDAGLVWVGPSPDAIAAMGSKTAARERMEAAGVPVLPGTTDIARAADVGFPLLVKASAGGGGKGMRVVERPEDLEAAVAAARREAASAFGDETVFLERYAPRARHVEIQIVGDTHGNVVAFGERDCSVQRRHQKVIEEAPSPVVDDDLRERMQAAAVAAGEAIGYVGAGTVEFLVPATNHERASEFFFLEVNTRLQVEHPVTELVTGVDLVAVQLGVAAGERVHEAPRARGWAIEARLYAEDVAAGFLPVTGTLDRFRLPEGARVDTGVEDGSVISPYYDPMIAKVVAHGRNREDAARRLADALARAELHGMTTNRDFLVRVLRDRAFLAGEVDTGWLDRVDVAALAAPLPSDEAVRLAAAAAALAGQAARRSEARVLGTLPSGWRNVPAMPQSVTFVHGTRELRVDYRFERDGRALAELRVDGEALERPRLHGCAGREVDFEAGGVRRRYRVAPDAVNTDEGQVDLHELPRFPDASADAAPGSLASPMPGTVIRVLAAAGDEVEAGRPLLVIEAMKMEHEVVAPAAGLLSELHVAEGAQVEAGTVLAVIADPAPAD